MLALGLAGSLRGGATGPSYAAGTAARVVVLHLQPRPQLDRLVTLTARLPPDQLEHLLGYNVEDE